MNPTRNNLPQVVVAAVDELADALRILKVCEYAVIGYSQVASGAAEYNIAALIEMGIEKVRAQERALAQVLSESRTP